jgi:DNA polymerase-3 subunit epsilon/ATP-dependent DNA helicase DinG
MLAIVNDIPQPGEPGHQKRIQEAIIELARETRGRAMVLFTSHSALQATHRAIKRPLEQDGILVLGQRIDGTPRQLIERLKAHPATVLLGTNSFWEGVDIVGDALSLLVITKLPFPVPSDPVFAARSELFDDPFNEYAVPQAILRFKQGFGRLIRSGDDRGVCVVLDRRIASRRYGEAFVNSLPECRTVVGTAGDVAMAVSRFLAALRDFTSAATIAADGQG